jgi:hypothetical protein
MKKLILSLFVLAATAGVAGAYDAIIPLVPGMGNEIGNMQNTDNQMRLLWEQQFRKQENIDYQDNLQEVKEKRLKEYKQYQEEKTKLYSPSQNLDFVRENGHLILKSVD